MGGLAGCVLPFLYVASFGPACWWLSSVSQLPLGKLPVFRRVPTIYRPIGWAGRRGPALLRGVVGWYATWLAGDACLECETEFGEFNLIWFTK